MPLMEEIKKKKKQVQNAIGGTIAQVPKVTVGEVAKTANRIGKEIAGTTPGVSQVKRAGEFTGGMVSRSRKYYALPIKKDEMVSRSKKYYALPIKKDEYAKRMPISKIGVIRRRARM